MEFSESQPYISSSELMVEYIYAGNNTIWQANYVDPSMGTLADNSFNVSGIVDICNGGYLFTQESSLRAPYQNDILMGTFKDQNYNWQGLTFECWVEYTNPELGISNRGWIMSYETGWGPALTLNDPRVARNPSNSNNANIGVTPGDPEGTSLITDASGDYAGLITDLSHTLLHLAGYYEYDPSIGESRKGIYINNVHREQISDSFPNFTNQSRDVLIIGGHLPTDMDHNCKGISIYGFRLWHKKLSSEEVSILYNRGKYGSV